MTAIREIIVMNAEGRPERWAATTLDKINKLEEYLEDVLAKSPQLLQLESRQSGIRGPFKVFQQLSLKTPTGREIVPDIVLLSGSGHVVIVEVKRYVNAELKDRRVIAQIIDYVASFSVLNENEITELFNRDYAGIHNWPELIQKMFPSETDCDELAQTLMNRFQSGDLNLIIACDKAPIGLDELVRGVATQSALGFELNLVEVSPYIRNNGDISDVIFIPHIRLATEIVARTAVTVSYRPSEEKPSINIQTTPIEEIEETMSGQRSTRQWDEASFFEDIENIRGQEEALVARKILDWAQSHATGIRWGKGQQTGSFVPTVDTSKGIHYPLFDVYTNGTIQINFQSYQGKPEFESESKRLELLERLNAIQGVSIPADGIGCYPSVLLSAFLEESSLNRFLDVYEWFLKEINGA